MINGSVSYWMQSLDALAPTRPAYTQDDDRDIVIIGAGFTGLWAAYRILRTQPHRQVTILERAFVGYGSSGRNDGWVSALLSANRTTMARQVAGGMDAVREFQRVILHAVDEFFAVLDDEHFDVDQMRGGHLRVARTPGALARLAALADGAESVGYAAEDMTLLDAHTTDAHIKVAGTVGGLFDRTTGKVHPGKLVTALAHKVEALGATIYESSEVDRVGPHQVSLHNGVTIRAEQVLVCTEAYSGSIAGMPHRRIVPVNSSIVLTRPLTDAEWASIGWENGQCFGDAAHVFTYAQRTADGRIAIGGRGKPYRYGSGTSGSGNVDRHTIELLRQRLTTYFPQLDGQGLIDNAWCGVIGVTRDWCAFVDYDSTTVMGTAGGYAGHGVTSAFAAANTLVDQMLGNDTPYAQLPWFGYRNPTWEPEPIRWVGIRSMYGLFGVADLQEERTHAKHTSLLARIGSKLTGM